LCLQYRIYRQTGDFWLRGNDSSENDYGLKNSKRGRTRESPQSLPGVVHPWSFGRHCRRSACCACNSAGSVGRLIARTGSSTGCSGRHCRTRFDRPFAAGHGDLHLFVLLPTAVRLPDLPTVQRLLHALLLQVDAVLHVLPLQRLLHALLLQADAVPLQSAGTGVRLLHASLLRLWQIAASSFRSLISFVGNLFLLGILGGAELF
jgi:hypothetical protein